MKENVGSADRMIRIILGLALLILVFVLEGAMRWIGLAGVVLLLTAAMKSCPLYSLFGMSTCPAQKK